MTTLMSPEGVALAKAFRDAPNAAKRRVIAGMARLIADMKE